MYQTRTQRLQQQLAVLQANIAYRLQQPRSKMSTQIIMVCSSSCIYNHGQTNRHLLECVYYITFRFIN
jgi:hypothetical protein